MAVLRNLVVKITGDTAGLQKSLGNAQSSVNSSVGSINKMSGKMSGNMQGMFSSIGGGANQASDALMGLSTTGGGTGIMFAAMAGIVVKGFTAMISMAQQAAASIEALAASTMPLYKEARENEVKLITIMRQRMGATDDAIKSMIELANVEQATGVTEGDAVIAGEQQLATFLYQTDALALLTPALADLVAQIAGANATSSDFVTIGNLLGKAMQGNAASLKKYGISFSDAQAEMLKTGTEMERAALLAQIITDNVGNMNQAMGDTNIGRIAQLTNAWGDLKEQVGAAFTNLLAAAAPTLIKIINWVAQALKWVVALSEMILGMTRSFVSGRANNKTQAAQVSTGEALADTNKTVAKSQDKVAKATGGATKAANKWLASFDQINKVSEANKGGGGGVSIVDDEELELPFGGVGELIDEEIEAIKLKIQEKLDEAKQNWTDFWNGTWLWEKIKEAWDNLKEKIPLLADLELEAEALGVKIKTTWQAVVNFAKTAWDGFKRGAIGVAGQLVISLTALRAVISTTWSTVKLLASSAWRTIRTGAVTVYDSLTTTWSVVSSRISTSWNTIVLGVISAWNRLRSGVKLTGTVSLNWDLITAGFSKTWDTVVSEAKRAINVVIDEFNKLIDKINSFGVNVPWWLGGGRFSLNMPRIPHVKLAQGGIVNSPTMAMIGEAGKEAVMPLENNTGWIDELAGKLSGIMGGGNLAMAGGVSVYIGGEKFDNFVVKSGIRQAVRSNGR